MSEYLTVEQVCGKLDAVGADPRFVSKVFAARLEPENLDNTDRKFTIGVPVPGMKGMLVVYRFGLGEPLVKAHPLDEGGPDLRPRFLAVEGPFSVEIGPDGKPTDDCELALKSKELTRE